jgi:hypothetical protein
MPIFSMTPKAVQTGHLQIEKNQIGLQIFYFFDCFISVAAFADNFNFRVIDEKHSDSLAPASYRQQLMSESSSACDLFLKRNFRGKRFKPPSGDESSENSKSSPYKCRNRSRVLVNP